MKTEQFSKLIKKAVREAVREEMETILSETLKPVAKAGSREQVYRDYGPLTRSMEKTGDTIMDLLNETRREMQVTYSEQGKVLEHGEDPGIGRQSTVDYSLMNEPGIDISKLSFVKNAAAIFNESVKKDKERLGG